MGADADLTQPDLAIDQYRSARSLSVRSAVWHPGPDGRTPQSLALDALGGRARVLEVGAGPGTLSKAASEQLSCRLIATDRSFAMAKSAQALGLDVLVADVQELPFPDEGFDAVIAAWMLFHLSNVPVAIAEIARVLEPGGILVAITNGEDHLSELWSLIGTPLEPQSFSRENGRSLLAGFFSTIGQEDLETVAVFEDRGAAARYVATVSPARADALPDLPEGLIAHGTPTVFVARKQ